ncbi:MAG: ARMT1-like domain-containing protein, partial [Sedimenticola sp.]
IPVTYVVKGGPAVNDATLEDAQAAGLDRVCSVIDNGAAILGTLLDQCSPEFRELFEQAELIIAKGMANFESLSGSGKPLFFLLQAKCPVISEHLGVAEKSIVVLEENR